MSNYYDTDALVRIQSSDIGLALYQQGLTREMLSSLPVEEQDRLLDTLYRAVRRLPIEALRALDQSLGQDCRYGSDLDQLAYHQQLNDGYLVTIEAQRRELEDLRAQLRDGYIERAALEMQVQRNDQASAALGLAAHLIQIEASQEDDERWDQVLGTAYAIGVAVPPPLRDEVDPGLPEMTPFQPTGERAVVLKFPIRPVVVALPTSDGPTKF